MSNRAVIAGALLLGYLYMNRNGGLPAMQAKAAGKYGPASMPASTGSGLQQVATGALNGFLGAIANGVRNNTPNVMIPSAQDYIDRSGIIQDAVPDIPTMDDLVSGDSFADWGWA